MDKYATLEEHGICLDVHRLQEYKIALKASFNIKPEPIKRLRYGALMDETTQTDIVDKLLTDFLEKWDKKNGAIPFK